MNTISSIKIISTNLFRTLVKVDENRKKGHSPNKSISLKIKRIWEVSLYVMGFYEHITLTLD